MGSQLSDLPVEIILDICAQLCTHCQEAHICPPRPHLQWRERQEIRLRRSALAALSRTSKGLHEIATPYLYHFLYHQRHDRGTTLPSLIQTVISRPNLAGQVRHIEIDHLNPCTLSDEVAEQLSKVAGRRQLRPLSGWSKDSLRRPLVLLELLLVHTPNVQTMHLLMNHSTTFSDLATFSLPADADADADVTFSLPYLKTLTVSRHPDLAHELSHFNLLYSMSLLLRFVPNLHTLSFHHAHETSPSTRVDYHFAFLQNLTSLTLNRCEIDLQHAGHLLLACHGLKIFHLVMVDDDTASHAENGMDPRSVFDALATNHASTLRVLTLDNRANPLARPEQGHVAESLRKLEKLDSLLVGLSLLRAEDQINPLGGLELGFWAVDGFLASALPRSVRRVHLTDDFAEPGVMNNVWGVSRAWEQGELKGLREISVYPGADGTMEQYSRVCTVQAVWAEKEEGLQLVWGGADEPIYAWA